MQCIESDEILTYIIYYTWILIARTKINNGLIEIINLCMRKMAFAWPNTQTIIRIIQQWSYFGENSDAIWYVYFYWVVFSSMCDVL